MIPESVIPIDADVLIIGGGTAGCMAALTAKELAPQLKVVIMEKAQIERSGCLAKGVNALNACIHSQETPESFVAHVKRDCREVVREDLLYSMAERLNDTIGKVEQWGLPIPRNEKGDYIYRSKRSIVVQGERLKPLLAKMVLKAGVMVINRIAATNFIIYDGQAAGAFGLNIRTGEFYVVNAKAVICATGGASGIYPPEFSSAASHKMWYSPFNTGTGYAMGIRAGAEMTTFEMRFITTRLKYTQAPTGALAQGFDVPLINVQGEDFIKKRVDSNECKNTTFYRVFAVIQELKEGRGPCFMDTTRLTGEQLEVLKRMYLNVSPDTLLFWKANGIDPQKEPIEISLSEPYVVGGHSQSGYWVDGDRHTTIPGLFAAGDVAGGAPKKYIPGCWVEGQIAARGALAFIRSPRARLYPDQAQIEKERERVYRFYAPEKKALEGITPHELEERLQIVMDECAGGRRNFFEMNEWGLKMAQKRLTQLTREADYLLAENMHELMCAHEVVDRIDVARVVVAHLLGRRETRWPGFQTRTDYPHCGGTSWCKFINSSMNPESGVITLVERDIKGYQQFHYHN